MPLSQQQVDLITEGYRAGQVAERKRVDALLETLPGQFNHQDHATRAIATARQLIARTHENQPDLRSSASENLEIRTTARIEAQDYEDDKHLTPELIVETVKQVRREMAQQIKGEQK